MQIAQYQEIDNSPNLPVIEILYLRNRPAQAQGVHLIPDRNQVNEAFSYLRRRPAPTQGAHLIPGRNQDRSGGTFLFDRSNPNSHLLDSGGFSLRLHSFYDWPEPLRAFAGYLAQNGFFYSGRRDKVACCYCLTQLLASALWEDSDIRRRVCLPHCPYTFNLNAV